MVQQFLDDSSSETLTLPKTITAAERDQIRQICKHFDVPFKVHGEGAEKQMVLRKPDFSSFEAAEEQQQAVFETGRTEIDRLKKLVVKLSGDFNLERMKLNTLMHQKSEVQREAALKEMRYLEETKKGICSLCMSRKIIKMNESCGHSCCTECFDVARCPICEQEVTNVVVIPLEIKPEAEPDSYESLSKRSRS